MQWYEIVFLVLIGMGVLFVLFFMYCLFEISQVVDWYQEYREEK